MSELRDKVADIMFNDAVNTKEDISVGETASKVINAVADAVEALFVEYTPETPDEEAYFSILEHQWQEFCAQAEGEGQEMHYIPEDLGKLPSDEDMDEEASNEQD